MITGKINNSDFLTNTLEEVCQLIKSYNENSENEFLEIGSRLQSYLSVSHKVSSLSSELLSSYSDNNLQKAISELHILLKKFSEYFSHSANKINSDKAELKCISTSINSLIDESDQFIKIVKHLKMLGISTKIESSRLCESDNGFTGLADNIDTLSALIKEKNAIILKNAFFLIDEIFKTTKAFEALENKQRKRADVIVDKIEQLVKACERRLLGNFHKTECFKRGSGNVSRNINDIVLSIQFHDIIRQQLEHVVEALTGASDSLLNLKDSNELTDDDYGMMHDVCALQVQQLSNSAKEYDLAADNIVKKLKSTADNMGDILSESNNFFEETDSESEHSLSSIEKELERISDGLKKNIEVEKELAGSINYVIKITDELTRFVLEIEDISSEIELLALNALIKAAHTEVNGSALSILAQEIQKLSINARVQTSKHSNILKNINDISGRLKINVSTSEALEETDNLLKTNGEISVLVDSMIENEKESKRKTGSINSDIIGLKKEIESGASNITIRRNAEVFFNEIKYKLNSVIKALKENTGLVPNKYQNTSVLMNNYSMEIERKIHQDYAAGTLISKGGDIPAGLNSDIESFGDNVELF